VRQCLAGNPGLATLDGQSRGAVPEALIGLSGHKVVDWGEGHIIEAGVVQRDVLGMAVRISDHEVGQQVISQLLELRLTGSIWEVGFGGLQYSFHAGGVLLVRRQAQQTAGVLQAMGCNSVCIHIEALHKAEREPDDWKPMPRVGSGVQEIRIRDAAGVFRVIFVAKFAAAIYVLHCFQKKTQKTSKTDLDLAEKRYRDLTKELAP
jgi:phage-related protein